MARRFLSFDMVTKTPGLLRLWWNNLNKPQQTQVTTHLGHLPTIMQLEAWPEFIEVITRFWDSERMVFRFGDVEITPTIEEFQDCLETIGMCNKRKHHPDHHILIPDKPNANRMKDILLLVKADWLDSPNLPFIKFFERWGHENYYENFPDEFNDYTTWSSTRALAFSICLLGTMVFPRDKENMIDSRIVMTANAIFNGVGEQNRKKYFNLVPVILADIYRSLCRCKNGHRFFQGCNLLLQWWMSKHLATKEEEKEQSLGKQEGLNDLQSHEFTLYLRNLKKQETREGWAQVLYGLKEGNIEWMFENFRSERIAIQGKRLPFLILVGIRGIRPYCPNRVMRQFGRRQCIPKQGDTYQYVIDYDGFDKVPYAREILSEWANRVYLKDPIAPDRYKAGYDEGYKEWLTEDLQGTITLGPHMDRQIEDIQAKFQIQARIFQQHLSEKEQEFQRKEEEYMRMAREFQQRECENRRILAFMTQELANARACLAQLDHSMERQITTLQQMPVPDRALLAEPFLTLNKYHIQGEVEKTKDGAGPSAFN